MSYLCLLYDMRISSNYKTMEKLSELNIFKPYY